MSIAAIHSHQGDEYQVAVAKYWVIRLLTDPSLQSVEFEAIPSAGKSSLVAIDDIVVRHADGAIRFIQAKKNQTDHKPWSIADLKDEIEKAARQWAATPTSVIEFCSRTPFGLLQKACEQARIYSDHDEFVSAVGPDLKKVLTQVAGYANIISQQAFRMILQFDFGSHLSFEDWNQQHRLLLGRRVSDVEVALDVIEKLVRQSQSRLGHTGAIDAAYVVDQLKKREVSFSDEEAAYIAKKGETKPKGSPYDLFSRDPIQYNRKTARSLGYDAEQDVRPNLIGMATQKPLTIVFGESGLGKSWALCAHSLIDAPEQLKFLICSRDINFIIEQINACQPNHQQLVVIVDGLQSVEDIEHVWQACSQKDACLIVSASNKAASEIKLRRIGGDQSCEVEVRKFSLSEVIELLRRNKLDVSSIPKDFIDALSTPLLARLFVKLSPSTAFTGLIEYQLFEAFWIKASSLSAHCAPALCALAENGKQPNQTIGSQLVQLGWLRNDDDRYEFVHERLKHWALAVHLTKSVSEEEIIRYQFQNTQPYLLLDWLWLNLPEKSKVADRILSFPDFNEEAREKLETLGGKAVPLLKILASDADPDDVVPDKGLDRIAWALRNEAIDQRDNIFGAELRAWLRSANLQDVHSAARVLKSVAVPEAFEELWYAKTRLKKDDDYGLRREIYEAVKRQIRSRPELLAVRKLTTFEQIETVCYHMLFDVPIGRKHELWQLIRRQITTICAENLGPHAIACARRFCDLDFSDQIAAIAAESSSTSTPESHREEAMVTTAILKPDIGIPMLLKHEMTATRYRQQWVPRASIISTELLARDLLSWFDQKPYAAICILQTCSRSIPPLLFERFVSYFAETSVQWSESELPRFEHEKLLFASENLNVWARLRDTEAEINIVRLLLSRPSCGHTTSFCLRALCAIGGAGIQDALQDSNLLTNCYAANQLLAIYAAAPICLVDKPRCLEGYCVGIIEVEGITSFVDRYLRMDHSNLPRSVFRFYQQMSASSNAYDFVRLTLLDMSNCQPENLYRAWCVLALAPNPDLNTLLVESISAEGKGHLWPLFQALRVAAMDYSTVSAKVFNHVRQGNADAMNFLLGLEDPMIDQQLADLVAITDFPHRDNLAASLLHRLPNSQPLLKLLHAERPNVMGFPFSMSTFARFGSKSQKEVVLEFARSPDDWVSSAQSDALIAFRHIDAVLSVELALSALRKSRGRIGQLCSLVAVLDKQSAAKRLLDCLAVNWSSELARAIGIELRLLQPDLVLQAIEQSARSANARQRRAAVLVAAWIPQAESIVETLLDDVEPDVVETAQIAFQIRERLRLTQHFADRMRASPENRNQFLHGYLDFVDPKLALTTHDALSVDWLSCGFSDPQKFMIEKKLKQLAERSIDYKKLSSHFLLH